MLITKRTKTRSATDTEIRSDLFRYINRKIPVEIEVDGKIERLVPQVINDVVHVSVNGELRKVYATASMTIKGVNIEEYTTNNSLIAIRNKIRYRP